MQYATIVEELKKWCEGEVASILSDETNLDDWMVGSLDAYQEVLDKLDKLMDYYE